MSKRDSGIQRLQILRNQSRNSNQSGGICLQVFGARASFALIQGDAPAAAGAEREAP